MRESFSEYKKTIEQNLQDISFLYSGDVLCSNIMTFSKVKDTPLTSPIFIISSLVEIYNKSFSEMTSRASEVIIPEESITDKENPLDKIIQKTSGNLKFIFGSGLGKKKLGVTGIQNNSRALPGYFYEVDNFFGLNTQFLISPLILEEEGETIFYVTDNPIQSLVWSIQNMDYSVEPTSQTEGFIPQIPTLWKHTMTYNFYNCRFNSWKVVIKNLSKIRNEKITQLLDGN